MQGRSPATGIEIRDQEFLARLRTLGSKAGGAARTMAVTADTEDALGLLGLPEQELTPGVRSALGDLIEEVAELRKELVTTQVRLAELERLADEDSLAPISNRGAFLRSLARTVGYVGRYGAACSLLYFDVNGLKSINDTRGHAAGDAALIHIAAMLRSNIRTSDIVGRLGGDEFGVLLTRTNEAHAENKAHQIAQLIAGAPFVWQGKRVPVSVAYGAHGLAPGEDPREALAAADRAMYRQKRACGGNPASDPQALVRR
jgi:diguanylate cyclase (GGDEF)-like protein